MSENREELRKEQKKRSQKYGIGVKEGGHLTKPEEFKDIPDEQFADPVNYRYPVDKKRVVAALRYFNRPDIRKAGGYTHEESVKVMTKIIESALSHGVSVRWQSDDAVYRDLSGALKKKLSEVKKPEGEPFAGFKDMDACTTWVGKNKPEVEDPAAYCASIMRKVEAGETGEFYSWIIPIEHTQETEIEGKKGLLIGGVAIHSGKIGHVWIPEERRATFKIYTEDELLKAGKTLEGVEFRWSPHKYLIPPGGPVIGKIREADPRRVNGGVEVPFKGVVYDPEAIDEIKRMGKLHVSVGTLFTPSMSELVNGLRLGGISFNELVLLREGQVPGDPRAYVEPLYRLGEMLYENWMSTTSKPPSLDVEKLISEDSDNLGLTLERGKEMSEGQKDLVAAFEELKSEITGIKEKVNDLSEEKLIAAVEQRILPKLSGRQAKPYGKPYGEPFVKSVIAMLKKAAVWETLSKEDQEKLEKMTGESLDEIKEFGEFVGLLMVAPTGEQAQFISAEDEADCKGKGGEWRNGRCLVVKGAGESVYPASTVAKVLAYMQKLVGKEFSKRNFSYVTRTLGATKETLESLPEIDDAELSLMTVEERLEVVERKINKEPTYKLPTGEEVTGEEAKKKRIEHGVKLLTETKHWGET